MCCPIKAFWRIMDTKLEHSPLPETDFVHFHFLLSCSYKFPLKYNILLFFENFLHLSRYLGNIHFAHFPVPFKTSSPAPSCPTNFAFSMLFFLIYNPAGPICPVFSVGPSLECSTHPQILIQNLFIFCKEINFSLLQNRLFQILMVKEMLTCNYINQWQTTFS